jgi:benzil reductase ((S)-benzoin forming)
VTEGRGLVPTDVAGRVAVITGASRGLGAGVAHAFAGAGLRLGLCARGWPALPEGPGVVARRLDVTDAAAVAAFAGEVAARFGGIDVWVNNAGVLDPIGPLRDLDPGAVAHNLAVNVLGVVHGTGAFVRHLHDRAGEGVLVNVSSGAAQRAYAGWSAYSAAKAAIDRLTEAVQLEEAGRLRAHAVSPGVVDTDMQAVIRATSEDRFPAVERFRDLGRRGAFNSTEHVARRLLALAFDPGARPEGVIVRLPDEHPG